MAEFTFTNSVVKVDFVSAADPTMRVVTEHIVAPTSVGPYASSWDDLTDKPSAFPPEAHTHEPGEVGADPRGMAVAAAAPTGVTVASYHHFGRSPDGPVHGMPTNGSGTYDPTALIDGRTYAGVSVEPYMEVAHAADGVLRHSGTRFLTSGGIALPAAAGHAVTLGYVDPIAGPGGGYPDIGMSETGYASTRVGFVDASMSGYFALLEQSDDTANHAFVINIELSGSPAVIAGPWDLGRRLTERDVWTFRHDGSQYVIMLNGDLIGSVYDDTTDPAEFAMAAAVLGTGSLWLPGVPWISTSLVVQRTAAWADITEKPADFPPATHSHSLGDLTTAELSAAKVLQPDGSGGVAWGTVSGGGGGAPFGEIPNRSGVMYAKPVTGLSPFIPSSANRIFYHAIPVDEIIVSGLSVVVATAASGETWRLGLYTDDNGMPDSLIVDAGDVAADTTGARTLTFTPVTVPAGFVWAAVICSGTASRLRGGSGGHYLIPGIMTTSIFGCYSSYLSSPHTSMPSTADVTPIVNQQGAPSVGLVIA